MHGISASPRRLPSIPVGRYEKAPTPTSARRYARNYEASWTPPTGTPVANNRHRFQHAVSTDETELSMALNDCSITPLESAYRSQSAYLTVTPDPKNFAPQSAAAKRKSFQRCSQYSMGQAESQLDQRSGAGHYGFSNSFDVSSVAFDSSHVAAAIVGAGGVEGSAEELSALDSAMRQFSGSSGAITGVNSNKKSTGAPTSVNKVGMRADRSASASSKNSLKCAISPPKSKGKSPPAISASSQAIIHFCMENARGDVANRVVSRMAHRRDDFAQFCASLPNDQCVEFITAFREYLLNVVKSIQSSERIRALSMEFGANQVPRRSVGFKADFFAAMAEALTTEGTFLDGATHQPTEAIEAWSELVELMFSNIRDGYYQQVRYLRRSSHCFQNQQYNHSSDLSTDGSEMQMLDATIPIPTTPTTSVRH